MKIKTLADYTRVMNNLEKGHAVQSARHALKRALPLERGNAALAIARFYPRRENRASGEGLKQMRTEIAKGESFEGENTLLKKKIMTLWNVLAQNATLFKCAQVLIQALER